ncbi:MAG: Hsp70 family protein [Deltaproteobacteria bacterium]|nr:Hsp70 family protein [Deltaproteobacteria bacterium]
MGSTTYVGIDLGTTNSAAAAFDGETITEIRTAHGSVLTPSVVRIGAKGQVTVGERARRYLESDPDNTRTEFKRLMGTGDKLRFPASGLERRPEELASEILKSLRGDIENQLGVAPALAVISVPALFELPQNAATSEAARLAGFDRVELLQEPIASALAAGWTQGDSNGSWLIYDLGGGTFDASLLETRDGLLRVVGHDGDNFLGGRDFDALVVDYAIARLLERDGTKLERKNPAHRAALARLKLAAEEAKIALSRTTNATISLPTLDVDGRSVELDLELTREQLEAMCAPLVDRSLVVCKRLLEASGSPKLERVVLVGGPTVMPMLRDRVGIALGASLGEGLDPMTLVARGAAVYAATAGLETRPTASKASTTSGRRVWLQYPAMSSDLTPHVVGRVTKEGDGADPASVRLVRSDGLFETPRVAVDAEGAFIATVQLLPRRPNLFRIDARDAKEALVATVPNELTIVQGLAIGDPPLSRSIGVARADDAVRVYFERGAPLPARRTFVHNTVESVSIGSTEVVLKIPIVQGEFEQAHLCRLVGSLEIPGEKLKGSLPSGSPVEVTLELDRGGRLSARALVPALDQIFEGVASLLVPTVAPEEMEAGLGALETRIAALRMDAFRRGAASAITKLSMIERALGDARRDVDAASGGDADAGQKARRTLLEVDAELESLELDQRWPELEDMAREKLASASTWIATHGTPTEQKLFLELEETVARAREAKDPRDLERQLRVVRDLGSAAFYRHPLAWVWMFEGAASELSRSNDLPRAELLVRQGRQMLERGDTARLRGLVEELWRLLPADVEQRKLGFDSGVR